MHPPDPIVSDSKFFNRGKVKAACMFPCIFEDNVGKRIPDKSFLGAIKIDPFPLVNQKADTVESIAKDLHKEGGKAKWNAFWNDAISFFDGDSTHLKGKEVLLGTDNALHAFGEECAVFFTPRQGSLDDEEVINEGALHEIPHGLKSYVAFLHEEIQIYDEKDARIQTQIRKFLEPLAKLVIQGFSIVWNPYNSVKCAGMELHLDGERGDRGQNSLILDALLPWTQCYDECSWF